MYSKNLFCIFLGIILQLQKFHLSFFEISTIIEYLNLEKRSQTCQFSVVKLKISIKLVFCSFMAAQSHRGVYPVRLAGIALIILLE